VQEGLTGKISYILAERIMDILSKVKDCFGFNQMGIHILRKHLLGSLDIESTLRDLLLNNRRLPQEGKYKTGLSGSMDLTALMPSRLFTVTRNCPNSAGLDEKWQ